MIVSAMNFQNCLEPHSMPAAVNRTIKNRHQFRAKRGARNPRERNQGRMKTFVALLLLASAAQAQITVPNRAAPDTKVFGIQMGASLMVPECAKEPRVFKEYAYVVDFPKSVCFENTEAVIAAIGHSERAKNPAPYGPVINGRVDIRFPIADMPSLSKHSVISGRMQEGKLVELWFATSVTEQESVLDGLKKKYGAPSSVLPTKAQNAFGTTINSVIDDWNFDNLSVNFQGTYQTIDEGLVTVFTPEGKAAAAARDKAKAGKPL
jgi:hypothetical protein